MKTHKKEVMFRKKSFIGHSNKHLPFTDKILLLDKLIQNIYYSKAFDCIFNMKQLDERLVEFQDKKVDKNLLEHLMKHSPSNLDEIRSKSQISRIRKDKSRSRTPLTKKLTKRSVYDLSAHNKNGQSNIHRSQNIQRVSDLYADQMTQFGHKKHSQRTI
jgi:hypothetical protein